MVKQFILRFRYLILSILIIVIVSIHVFYGKWGGDFYDHSAVIRELTDNTFRPGHPFFLSDAPHAFFSPYALLVASTARMFNINYLSVF